MLNSSAQSHTGMPPGSIRMTSAAPEGLRVRGTISWAFIPGHDAQRGRGHALLDKGAPAPGLGRAQWRVRLGHQDGRARSRRRCRAFDVLLAADGQRGWISPIGPKPSCGVSM
jgi:hypothetical protein